MEKQIAKSTAVATVNGSEILIIENGEKRVAIKPICQALGVSVQGQLERLKTDPILNSVVKMVFTTGADGKQYEMVTIPFFWVYGWLFRIDSRNVKSEAREALIKYQKECYRVLYEHNAVYAEFVEYKQKEIDARLETRKEKRKHFTEAKNSLKTVEDEIEELRKLSLEDYKAKISQQLIEFPEDAEAQADVQKGEE